MKHSAQEGTLKECWYGDSLFVANKEWLISSALQLIVVSSQNLSAILSTLSKHLFSRHSGFWSCTNSTHRRRWLTTISGLKWRPTSKTFRSWRRPTAMKSRLWSWSTFRRCRIKTFFKYAYSFCRPLFIYRVGSPNFARFGTESINHFWSKFTQSYC